MIFDEIKHEGTPRHSGRYPWGSGENPYQRSLSFQSMVSDLRKQGLTQKEIAEGMGILGRDGKGDINALRAKITLAKAQVTSERKATARKLYETQMSKVAIAKEMGIPEGTVRSYLSDSITDRNSKLNETAGFLKSRLSDTQYLDVGLGSAQRMGVSREHLNAAIYILKEEGYAIHKFKSPQLGTDKETQYQILVPPGTSYKEFVNNKDRITPINFHSSDMGRSFTVTKPPKAMSPSRVFVRYVEDGGGKLDGVIQLRRNVDDISLGKANYAQVRIRVGKKEYLKGMAMYGDDIPDGYDVVFNTNKSFSKTSSPFKELKFDADGNLDADFPFGALIKPGGQRGVLNIVGEEGDWGKWSKSISAQALSKQTPQLAKTQLDLRFKSKIDEYDEILRLTNPAVRKSLLEKFADDADSSSVHLKAAALPRQGWHSILPINSLKETEVYAPKYNNGEHVVLIRYPHGGRFEIPELVVNNRNREANSLIKGAADAIGIHFKVAERLSGADFDGDTVLLIPNNDGRFKSSPQIESLKGFDPKHSFPPFNGMKTIDGGIWNDTTKSVDFGNRKPNGKTKQRMMGEASNLITDMTLKGANRNEIAKAVKFSMVVIDSEKHHLNVKQAFKDNDIGALKARYQKGEGKSSGASTIISRASSDVRNLPARRPRPAAQGGPIDPTTGKRVFVNTGESYVKDGKTIFNKAPKSTKMAETDDAFSLVSDNAGTMEVLYATYANKLKGLANDARKKAYETQSIKQNKSAKKAYEPEVKSLLAKLNLALQNKPLERNAQLIGNAIVKAKRAANPQLDGADLKKIKAYALAEGRIRARTQKQVIDITTKEWAAIQQHAITNNILVQILNNSDPEQIKQLATPREGITLSPAKLSHAKALLANGYTQAEVASQIGVSVTTLMASVDGKES